MKQPLYIVFLFVLISPVLASEDQWQSYFNETEIKTIKSYEKLNKKTKNISFRVRQIINERKALVDSGGRDYIYIGDVSNYVDDDTFSTIAKEGEPISYTTVLGSKRTLRSYIEISNEDRNLIKKAAPLLKRQSLVIDEIEKNKRRNNFDLSEKNINKFIEISEDFLNQTSGSSNEEVESFRKKLEFESTKLKQAISYRELSGKPILDEDINTLVSDTKTMALKHKIAVEEKLKREKYTKEQALQKQRAIEQNKANEFKIWSENINTFRKIKNSLGKKSTDVMLSFSDQGKTLTSYSKLEICLNQLDANKKYKIGKAPSSIDDVRNTYGETCSPETLESLLNRFKEEKPTVYFNALN